MSRFIRYEDLTGALGRRIHYRPERFGARDLFGPQAPVVEIVDHRFPMHDASMTGVAFNLTHANREFSAQFMPGANLPFKLLFDDTTLFESEVRVSRVEIEAIQTKIGVHFVGGYLDIPEAVARHREVTARRAIAGAITDEPLVPAAYRQLCADVLHLLRRYRAVLDPLDVGNVSGDSRLELRQEMLAQCEDKILPEWRKLWAKGNSFVESIMGDTEVLQAVKRYTELVLTPDFMDGPIWRRSYEKPRGFPGDFEIMNYVYAWRPEGETTYGRLVHRLGLDVAECIATRMVLVQQAIAALVKEKAGTEPVRIGNLGCGPAQEVVNYLKQETLPGPVEFTLLDQDHEALACAHGRIYRELGKLGDQVTVKCLNASFVQMSRAGALFGKLPPQDMIYSIGLVDYFAQRRARTLVADLFDHLAPGGLLMIGNMRATPTGNLWPMEFIADWSLHYRNEAEMLDLAAGLDCATVELKIDPTGRVHFICLRRAA
jgi:chemotaxis methyl-accepting protein methylase